MGARRLHGGGYQVLVCNPNQEAWKWKNVKRKTDRDDALKLAKLVALGQLVPVYIPSKSQREYRRLVKYRQVLLGRMIVCSSPRRRLAKQLSAIEHRPNMWLYSRNPVILASQAHFRINEPGNS